LADGYPMKRVIGVASALFCASCAPLPNGQQYFGQAMQFCDLIANESRYAGQHVLVSAYLMHTPHGRELFSPECEVSAELRGSSDLWDGGARRAVQAWLSNNKLARVPVVVSGVFQPWTRHEDGHPVINVGGPYIEDGRIVAARQP
jgi:hypothetical protein